MARSGKSKNMPEGWELYSNMGLQIPGTRFVPLKCPLSWNSYDVRYVVNNLPDLGLVIDLTNTDRYYNPIEFRECGVQHYKLNTFGHAIPHDYLVQQFFHVVDEFLKANRNNNKVIAVHCTHGINRSGYMMVRYMIQKLNVQPDTAIAAFSRARGHAIERDNYLKDLKNASWPKVANVRQN